MGVIRLLKTQKGSLIKRSKYGIGKDIGGSIYFHRSYIEKYFPFIEDLPAYEHIRHGRPGFNLVKWEKSLDNITLFKCADFDTAHEPTAGEWHNSNPDGKIQTGRSTQILHHKWLWVDDDYFGFDVQESIKRSQQWLAIPDVNFSKIGNKDYWYPLLKKHKISF